MSFRNRAKKRIVFLGLRAAFYSISLHGVRIRLLVTHHKQIPPAIQDIDSPKLPASDVLILFSGETVFHPAVVSPQVGQIPDFLPVMIIYLNS